MIEALGVHRGHISKIERGIANPSKQLIKLISKEFGVREEWLLEGKSPLKEIDDLTLQEIEELELNAELIRNKVEKMALRAVLPVYGRFLHMTARFASDIRFALMKRFSQDRDLSAIKEEIEFDLDMLIHHFDSLLENLKKQELSQSVENAGDAEGKGSRETTSEE